MRSILQVKEPYILEKNLKKKKKKKKNGAVPYTLERNF